MMESRTAQLQINKEPPEALEVLSLDNLTSRILKRNDISDWEKASLLTSTLERFLALKPKAFNEPAVALGPPAEESITKKVPKEPRKHRSRIKVRRDTTVERVPEIFHTPEGPSKTRSGKRFQTGTENASGLCCRMNGWLPSVLRFCRLFKINCVSSCCNGEPNGQISQPKKHGQSRRDRSTSPASFQSESESDASATGEPRCIYCKQGGTKEIQKKSDISDQPTGAVPS